MIELTSNYPYIIRDIVREGELDLAFEVLFTLEDIYTAKGLARDIARSEEVELSEDNLDRLVEMWAEDPGGPELMAFIVHYPPELSDEHQAKLEDAWGTEFEDLTLP